MKTVKFWLSIFALTCAVGCSSGKTGDPATLVTCVEKCANENNTRTGACTGTDAEKKTCVDASHKTDQDCDVVCAKAFCAGK